ncbi:MAG: 5-formyltetrahydrofolate cyclo-ligase [Paracoccaceae bacterium]
MTDPADTAAAKAAMRRRAFDARKRAHAEGALAAHAAGRRLIEALDAMGALAPDARVAAYRPIRTEIDPGPALDARAGRGVALAMPVVEGPDRPLAFRPWRPGAAEVEGAFGAAIPADPASVPPTALVVPLVAFDAEGYRLGYGGGFYDRTLEALRAANPSLTALGLAYDAQAVDRVVREATDQPLDAVVTETCLVATPHFLLRRGI